MNLIEMYLELGTRQINFLCICWCDNKDEGYGESVKQGRKMAWSKSVSRLCMEIFGSIGGAELIS